MIAHRIARLGLLACCIVIATGCATTALHQADQLSRTGDIEGAYQLLHRALKDDPHNAALRTAQVRARDRVVVRALAVADLALASGRSSEALQILDRIRTIDPGNPRLSALEAAVAAEQRARAETPARRQAARKAPVESAPLAGAALRKLVTLEFRDAPLRTVFESLARSSSVNFVFDKDVRPDTRVTVFLRDVALEDAIRVILATQQLDHKLLNESTVMVYPNTPLKQREHQELITRSFYLTNTTATQALALVRTMAKTRDLHADERLNALVVRDTPEVVQLVERLVSTVDLPDPEVMLAIEVLEVASDGLDSLGLSWPATIQYGIPNAGGQLPLGDRAAFRGSVLNPAVVATLRAQVGSTNLLANPTIRARNREKAKVQIGEKYPVFTTTSTANVGLSASVSYLDVGLKLEVEPSVQLDGEVTIRVALEVSNLLREVVGPAGSIAYEVGTRLTTTSLRLRDGQTQVLAGLINDEDRKRATGVPGLSTLPLVGRLFGVHDDGRKKTEIVMLITPRVVRNLHPPSAFDATLPSGTEASPGSRALRLRAGARAGLGTGSVAPGGLATAPAASGAPAAATANEAPAAAVVLSATDEVAVGDTASVTLGNRTEADVEAELIFDPAIVQLVSAESSGGRWPVAVGAGQDAVVVFRVLPGATPGIVLPIAIGGLSGRNAEGQSVEVPVEGQIEVRVRGGPPGVLR